MKLSIIIPVYNEEKSLETILHRVESVELPVEREIVVIEDGSTDRTKELVKQLARDGRVIPCYHRANEGKGAAIRTGMRKVTGDIVLIQDGDMEYDPSDYPKLLAPILQGTTRVVYGSRILGKNPFSYVRFYLGGRILSLLANCIYGITITDEPTCYKVFDATLLKGIELECRGFDFCPEVTAKVARLGEKIQEVPISYTPRSIEEGKKISWKDGVIAVWTLIRFAQWKPDDAR